MWVCYNLRMPPRFLTTSRVAKAVGVHPNTVRIYEQMGFLPPIPRTPSGYRKFTQEHLEQMRIAWLALRWPFPGGRAFVEKMVRTAANGDLGGAHEMAFEYLARIRAEQAQAEAAVEFLERWARGQPTDRFTHPLRTHQSARLLGLTNDVLRNWERNGLISVPRDPRNGYRQYGAAEIGRLRVIRVLRKSGYSMMAILRMMTTFDRGVTTGLREALDTPNPDEDVITTADRWLSTLKQLEQQMLKVIELLEQCLTSLQRPKHAFGELSGS